MKKLYLFAALAAMLAACSENDLTAEKQVVQQNAEEGAVVFDAYQSRGTTRAGLKGTMTLANLQKPENEGGGFGVFGYYTNNEGYSELAKPDFMYNQMVTYSTGGWGYAPIKYWPNEFGTEATSERVDYLTFFAYAPYVDVEPKTGRIKVADGVDVNTGIVGLTRNTSIGDPLVKYVANFDPAQCVDLCWGVAAENFTETVTDDQPKNDIAVGKPFIDVIKPQTSSKIKFDFKHALAQLNVQIDADIDDDAHSHALPVAENTRIYVRSVSFEGFTDRGTLNLNSDATETTTPVPTWYDIAGTGNLSTTPVTIYDKRYDGREGVANVAAPAESPFGLNDDIIQSKPYTISPFDSDPADPGVTKEAVNLFKPYSSGVDAKSDPILVIPNGQSLKIKVVYDVETYDPSLATFLSDGKTHGSTIENAITQTIKLLDGNEMKLESGKRHVVRLHLGLTSVKFDAAVTDWGTFPVVNGEGDLPINKGAVVKNGETLETTMPAAAGTYEFTFKDVTGSDNVGGTIDVSGTPTDITTLGFTITNTDEKVTIGVPENKDLMQQNYEISVSDGGTNSATITIKQDPAALGLGIDTKAVAGGTTFKLSCATGLKLNGSALDWSNATVKINYTRLREGKTTSVVAPTTAADGTVTLAEAAQAGDVYTIEVQAGDAAKETKSFTVDYIPAEIVFTKTVPSSQSYTETECNTSTTEIVNDNPAKLQVVAGGSAITPDGSTITYTCTNADYFEINTSGVLKFKGTWVAGDARTVEVTATVKPGKNYSYAKTSVSYSVTVTATTD